MPDNEEALCLRMELAEDAKSRIMEIVSQAKADIQHGVEQSEEAKKQHQARSERIKEGVSKLEKVKQLQELLEIEDEGEIAVYLNARKVQYLRDLNNIKADQDAALADLKKKLSSLSKLEIIQKVPKQDRTIGKPILAKVTEIMSREG